MKVVLAALLLSFDYKLVDANGSPVHKVPFTNMNDYQQVYFFEALVLINHSLTFL